MDKLNDDLASELISEWNYLFGRRGTWNTHWTEIAQRVFPMESFLFQNFSALQTQGDKRNQEVYDSTAVLALNKFGAILDSLLTPRDQFWHILTTDDPVLKKDKATRVWLEQANNILSQQRYAPRANFAAQNQGQYMSLGAYGTGCLFTDDLDTPNGKKGLRYKHVHLGEVYLQENHQGIIDRVCRYFRMTARQAFKMFDKELGDKILSSVETSPESEFFFLHWVMPRSDRDPFRKDFKGMEFASYYVSIEDRKVVKESGYRTFPYSISRYYQAANESYGRSVAMDALPTIKTANEMKKTMLKQGHRVVDPVLLAHDDGIVDGFNMQPGAINAGGISSDGRMLIQAMPTGNVQAGKEFMDEEKGIINDHFLLNLFQILTENPEMTATEVLERTREKGILLAPVIGRQQSEYLGPLIERELDILSRQGLLPPQPKLLAQAKGEYKIMYDSPITRTQKAEWASGAQRTIESLMTVSQATQDPSLMDYINFDVAAPIIAEINGTPSSWIREPKDIAKIRQNRQQMAQQQQAIQAAPAVAGVMKAKAAAQGPGGGQQQ